MQGCFDKHRSSYVYIYMKSKSGLSFQNMSVVVGARRFESLSHFVRWLATIEEPLQHFMKSKSVLSLQNMSVTVSFRSMAGYNRRTPATFYEI